MSLTTYAIWIQKKTENISKFLSTRWNKKSEVWMERIGVKCKRPQNFILFVVEILSKKNLKSSSPTHFILLKLEATTAKRNLIKNISHSYFHYYWQLFFFERVEFSLYNHKKNLSNKNMKFDVFGSSPMLLKVKNIDKRSKRQTKHFKISKWNDVMNEGSH